MNSKPRTPPKHPERLIAHTFSSDVDTILYQDGDETKRIAVFPMFERLEVAVHTGSALVGLGIHQAMLATWTESLLWLDKNTAIVMENPTLQALLSKALERAASRVVRMTNQFLNDTGRGST